MLTLEEIGVIYQDVPDQQAIYAREREHTRVVGAHPECVNWDDYWGGHASAADPTYLRRTQIFRYQGRFIHADAGAELSFHTALKEKLFRNYFSGLDAVAEFGCGAGRNLEQLRSLYPTIARFGYDWSLSAVRLASSVATTAPFDMKGPTEVDLYDIGHLGVLTCGAMEQLGDDFMPFYSFLSELGASVYVHIEPLLELYGDSEFDQLAVAYHHKRGYLGRFLTELRRRAAHVEARTGFGNIHNEGYMVAIWE